MFLHSYLQTAERILTAYKGDTPFAAYLKEFFRQSKKHGSRDRKVITQLCYSYFRLGGALQHLPLEDRIRKSVLLTAQESSPLLEAIDPSWNAAAKSGYEQKCALIGAEGAWKDVFPLPAAISREIDSREFTIAHWLQPNLFIRLRPGREDKVRAALVAAGIAFTEPAPSILALPNGSKTEGIFEWDKDAVIQDLNSAQVLQPLLKWREAQKRGRFTVWDCCAASGGKSILVKDQFPGADLTVSDLRQSILYNLQNRFHRAGISQYRSFTADVSLPHYKSNEVYDVVLCDAPCSGSGTWGRTPEHLSYFDEEKLQHYVSLQRSILQNVARSIKKGGALLYITCSVYAAENEENVQWLTENTSLITLTTQYFKGYGKQADTLFTALLTL